MVIEFDITEPGRYRLTKVDVVPPPPPASIKIINEGEVGFAIVGAWDRFEGDPLRRSFAYTLAGTGLKTASWAFSTPPGRYRVSTTWLAQDNRSSSVQFTIIDGLIHLGMVQVDQRILVPDLQEAGSNWKDLGIVTTTGNSLVVSLTDLAAPGYVIAGAIRIAPSDVIPPPVSGTLPPPVSVQPQFFQTHHDKVPNPTYPPGLRSRETGDWSDPGIWEG
mgnify:CR=1 FL=1